MPDAKLNIIVSAVDKASAQIKQMTGGFDKFKSSALGVATQLGIATIGIGTFVNVAKKSIEAASNLNETITKTGVIFGESAKDIEIFAETAASALGQSKQQAMDASSTFATFGKAAGLSGKELVGFSTKLTQLSADFASFYNTSPEDAITAIGAALRGESEPIRRYGVLLDDATLRQKALEMGIVDTTKNALTPQQRTLAAYQVILARTGDAQGDFARTSDGMANQTRILNAELENLKTELGEGLLPAANFVTVALVKATRATNSLSEETKEIMRLLKLRGEIEKIVYKTNEKGLDITQTELDNTVDAYLEYGRAAEKGESLRRQAAEESINAYEALLNASKEVNAMDPRAEEARKKSIKDYREIKGILADVEVKYKNLVSIVGGTLTESTVKYREGQRSLNQEAKKLQDEIDILSRQAYLTEDQRAQLLENKAKLKDIQDQIKTNADEHAKATKQMMFDLIAQRAAMDGLTSGELSLLTAIAEKWGLVDQATVDATKAADKALTDFANGQGLQETIDQLYRALALTGDIRANLTSMDGKTFKAYVDIQSNYQANLPSYVTGGGGGGDTTTTTQTNNSQGTRPVWRRASGGPVVAGYPYIVGERGAELFVPSRSGSIVNNNNFSMTVHSNAAVSTLTRDYALMKALAN